ncbi:MAG TPA: SUMF1/EgtB/PvdO family nonheme iron enzyme [Gemmataceae bacterium]|nr:SUMF1/EgtB/PvdO family nonheme iron enzyme [Gemmataceae bacterium]
MNDPMQTVDEPERQPAAPIPAPSTPQHIGRYRVERVLGKGGFGLVYLAHDGQLQRLVAIKVPHRKIVPAAEDAEAYLIEARTVANLDHPNIVTVYDAGSTEQFPCFIVSKFIDGTDLATKLKQSRLSLLESVELAATVAEALHHAHKQALVHRDIKPGNILLDKSGKPFVADFGLALREQDLGRGPRYAGTPAYMSPEQARGEGHRVDGRSDIFSLGAVFYELLVGRQPFRADSQAELREQVTTYEPRPPRQIDDGIPKELERICLKALAKRASERYSTAKDMADDLRHFLAEQTIRQQFSPEAKGIAASSTPAAAPPPSTAPSSGRSAVSPATTPTSDHQPVKIVPKGLRSFDAHDADFFLELVPGPRDRDGLPDSIRFWKTRIEETDAEKTFAVGLICGPSGCGKSSLMKAGLLPRLCGDVLAVYVEATAAETEARLLNGLRKRCPALPANLDLKETLAALRRGQCIPAGKKVLIVLDQFEQWLHAKKEEENTDLVQALRQCDGSRLQCLVMVRDDFWMTVIRFMRELEIRLVEGQNSAAVDLFPIRHAEKVLAAFGRAFGVLPENSSETSSDQKHFLEQAVSGLAQEGKVISVRLALFAEMMKGKAWTPASLKAVGGAEGVGVVFLEETFSAATAPPEHRYHQKAARAVLKALLPEAGTDIKGHMRSHQELLQASGYVNRPKDFEDLLKLLDSEIRLITPTDPEGKEDADPSPTPSGARFYQLTHDYLVPSLRDWLTRKQKETRRGRAELLLADRAAVWDARPENRLLPGWWDWLSIRLFTRQRRWTPTQRRMMSKALRSCVVRTGAVLLLCVMVLLPLCWYILREAADGLVESIVASETTEVSQFIEQLEGVRYWADPMLRKCLRQFPPESKEHLHASLALLPVDASQLEYLFSRLLDAEPKEVPVIRDALAPHKDGLIDKLWAAAEAPDKGKELQRLRAAAALANYDPASAKWAKCSALIVGDLVQENPVFLLYWSEAYRPVKDALLKPLADIFRDPRPERAAERSLATNLLTDYAADKPQVLADLLMDADDKQFAVLFPKFKEQGERGLRLLTGTIDKKLPSDLPSSDDKREHLAKRQANAAAALLRMNQPEKVWPLLKHSSDPRARSYLIHRLGPLGADGRTIIERLDEVPDLPIRRALLLSLGEFGEKELPPAVRQALLPRLQDVYRTDADPGLHAAAEWLLRTWQQQAWLKQVNDNWAKDKVTREKRLQNIRGQLKASRAASAPEVPPQWYVNGQGQTMVVIPGPVEFLMGSPGTEAGRRPDESQHKKRIGRTFAIAATAVTKEQFLKFWPGFSHNEFRRYPETSCPIGNVVWYEAAAYCNWLSKQEGIAEDQWCYEIKDGQVTKLKANYLSRTGYRLPTEAEMEYATRAGALTSRHYGETEELLPKYAWTFQNSGERTWPVGRLKPNDFGLFDTHGNVYTWCQERYKSYPLSREEVEDDTEDSYIINIQEPRVLRGGSFDYLASNVRCAGRIRYVPAHHDVDLGFRPARTFR